MVAFSFFTAVADCFFRRGLLNPALTGLSDAAPDAGAPVGAELETSERVLDMNRTSLLLTLWSALLTAPLARADRAAPLASPSHRVRFDLGAASALGFGGLSYTYAPVDWFQLETGVGMGLSGPTLSLMPKYAVGSRADHLVLGAGVSLARNWANFTGWLNADVGWEHLFGSGVILSTAIGVTAGEQTEDLRRWEGRFRRVLPQLRFGVGYAFGGGRDADEGKVSVVEEEPERPWTRRNRLGFDLGVFSALGLAGVSYARQLAEPLALEAGVGLGGSGLQLSLMPKLTLGSNGDYYVAGLGVAWAVGESRSPMFWVNADLLGYERRLENGLGLSISLGATACLSGQTTGYFAMGKGFVAPQLRLGAAWWF